MGSLFRRTYTDRQGVKRRAKKWTGQYTDETGTVVRVTLSSNKSAALQQLAEYERRVELARAGIVDRTTEHARRPIAEHLDDWEAYLLHKGSGEKHVQTTKNRADRVIKGCGWERLGDIDGDKCLEYLAGLVEADFAPNTVNYYLREIQSFTRWLAKPSRRRLTIDPLAELAPRAVTEIRRGRRALSAEQLGKLLQVALASEVSFRGLAGRDRHYLYLTAMSTGFRAEELSRLAPEAFALDAEPPTATVGGANTKNHKAAVQPLPPGPAAALREYLDGKPPAAPIWPGVWWQDAAEMLRLDLAPAGIPYSVPGPDGPRYADFHALRHSYVTLLIRSGANVKDVQTLARHSTVKLTLGLYTHAELSDRATAAAGLPDLLDTKLTLADTGAGGLVPAGEDGEGDSGIIKKPPGAGIVLAQLKIADGIGEQENIGRGGIRTRTGFAPQRILSPRDTQQISTPNDLLTLLLTLKIQPELARAVASMAVFGDGNGLAAA